MKSKTSNAQSTLGVDELPGIDEIQKNLVKDLQRAMGALNAIYSDPDLCKSVATWIHGRALNEINKRQAEAQLPDGEFKGKRL